MIQRHHRLALWQLVSITKEDFEKIYIGTVDQFELFMQEQHLIDAGIECAIRALKIRRAYMLPVGADTETCYRQNTAWTYAVFVSALTLNCWQKAEKLSSDNYALMMELLPSSVQTWFGRFPNIRKMLQFDPVTIKANENVLAEIIYRAKQIQAKNVELEKQNAVPDENSTLSDALFNWINESLHTKTMTLNHPKGFIYRVQAGIFLIIPDCYEQFAKHNPRLLEYYLKDKQNLDEFIAQLTANEHFTKADKGYLHRYFWGEWKDRLLSDGLVLSTLSLIFGSKAVAPHPQLNVELKIR